MQAGLSFEQAPPLSVPLRFFLSAPFFLLAAGLLLAFAGDTPGLGPAPAALAATHAVTLGFLAMVMTGAMMQMLPVVAGVVLPHPRALAWATHLPLGLGTATLMAAFWTGNGAAFGIAAVLLALAFGTFLVATGRALRRARAGDTVSGMRHAWLALVVTVVLGILLALTLGGRALLPDFAAALATHARFGLAGWVLLLVIGVAYQVVPMFQITPAYPRWLRRGLTPVLLGLLVARGVAPALPAPLDALTAIASEAGLAIGGAGFALATLVLQARRRRKLPDVTLDFWRVGMISLLLCALVALAGTFVADVGDAPAFPALLGVLFIGGFAVSVVNGMLYKIVPFLAWFHLQAQLDARAGTIPNMKEMIAEPATRRQFRAHLAALALLVLAVFWPRAAAPWAGLALSLSALFLSINLLAAARRFARHGGRFG
jgi:hypothetical protein